MNNPYRARPGRTRADSNNAVYGIHTQKPWNTTPSQRTPGVEVNKVFQPIVTPVTQPKQSNDSWDWGTENSNNGNDSWNWSIDQQSETQPQQTQSHQYNAQPITGQNQPPPIYNPQANQENFYENINGNEKLSNREISNVGVSRESLPYNLDSFPQHPNFTRDQITTPPRPNLNKSHPAADINQVQWTQEQKINNSVPQQQNQAYPTKNQVFTPSHNTTNNYPWNIEQQNISVQNQQNQNESSVPFWNENTSVKSESFSGNINDQWNQQNQQFQQNQPKALNEQPPLTRNNEPAKENWSTFDTQNANQSWSQQNISPSSNQFQKDNRENVTNFLPRQQSLPSSSWVQPEDGNSQNWQQTVTSNNQRRHSKLEAGGSLEESILSENSNKNDWQQIHAPPPYFASSTTSTTSGSLANMSSSTEQLEDRKKSLTPGTSSTSLNEFSSQHNHISSSSTDNSVITSYFQNHNSKNANYNDNADLCNITTSELASGVSNISLDAKSSLIDNKESSHSIKEEHFQVNDWETKTNDKKLENKPEINGSIRPEQISSKNQSVLSTEQLDHHVEPVENIPQGSYDQWYNQNLVRTQSDNQWYQNDQKHSLKQWLPNQNIENNENIQHSAGDFVNLEVVSPEVQQKDVYGSHDSINKENLEVDQNHRHNYTSKNSSSHDFQNEISNLEASTVHQIQHIHTEQVPDNYEFASNDRNTFLETGELTDSHLQNSNVLLNQDEENDEVPNDIPFLREVPGQSSSNIDPRRNVPTGQEQYVQNSSRISDSRRNDPSGQEDQIQNRNLLDRRDVPSGQERSNIVILRNDNDLIERRNDPSGRERSIPPQQLRNEPSGEEQINLMIPANNELNDTREVPGQGNEQEDNIQQTDNVLRQIPGSPSSNDSIQSPTDSSSTRVVTGSQEVNLSTSAVIQEQISDNRNKREEAIGALMDKSQTSSQNRRDSYEDGDDEDSVNSRDNSRDRRRESSPKSRHSRYEYNRKSMYYDRDRDYDRDDDYYYEHRRGADYDRAYNSREDLDRRDTYYRDEDSRRHPNRDEKERHSRDDIDKKLRKKDDIDDTEGRKRLVERRRDRSNDSRRYERDGRDYDPRYLRDRDLVDRDRRRDDKRSRRYVDMDPRDVYRRDYYEDACSRNSRPPSRSSYNERERDYYVRPRDPYSYGYPNYPSYDYGANYNSNYYAYLENLRRTDPAAYTEWYHKYYQQQQNLTRGSSTTYPEDRASVHSGRSSCEDRNSSDRRNLTDTSLLEDQTVASSRLTPTKFSTAHARGSFSIGSILHVHATYPADGERAKVDVLKISSILHHDPICRELRNYPGPLISGITHKKKIIEYCETKIKTACNNDDIVDYSSYVLLYEFMIMLIQQNGKVVGVDIASLLLRNKETYPYESYKNQKSYVRRESTVSQRSEASASERNINDDGRSNEKEVLENRKTIEQLTDEFRNTLLYGLVQEALEFAMAEGLWGHALFLASKLDKRTHASVMARFANSLPAQDPLQTLYQLHSGRVPSSVTCLMDSKWDDWRPHLAMIISNTSSNPEVNCRSITTLGDTLLSRGDIYAAHFCYILSQVDFGAYGANNTKLVLIGANHNKSYNEFLSLEAIMLTEIYEYARKLSEPEFTLIDLQTFKFDLAMKMADYGLIEKALLYIEQVAINIVNQPSKYKQSFINNVYTLGDRLKYNDPVFKDSIEDVNNLSWLNNLFEVANKCEKGEIIQDNTSVTNFQALDTNQEVVEQSPKKNQTDSRETNEISSLPAGLPDLESKPSWQQHNLLTPSIQESNNVPEYISQYNEDNVNANNYQTGFQQNYWTQQTYDQQDFNTQNEWQQTTNADYAMGQSESGKTELQNNWTYESQQPLVSLTPKSGKQYDPLEELESLEPTKLSSKTQEVKKSQEKTQDKKNTNSGSSWFGGLFSKLAPKPKNQMILPDDSNPSIVWDPVAKKWLNKEEDESNTVSLAPPPKADLQGLKPAPVVNPISQPVTTTTLDETLGINSSKMIAGSNNMYKMPKNRNMRANYVDLMNPMKSKSPKPTLNAPTPGTSPAMPMAASSPQLFIPTPVNDPNAPIDFLTPTVSQPVENAPHELSRWSSTSSLSREVQSYTMKNSWHPQRAKAGPLMYNPSEIKDNSQKNAPRSRYPPR